MERQNRILFNTGFVVSSGKNVREKLEKIAREKVRQRERERKKVVHLLKLR